jgi:hypothetical protein
MKFTKLVLAVAVMVAGMGIMPVQAEIVYTPVNISIPPGSGYNIDFEHDGTADFTLRSTFLQDYCQTGDGYVWVLNVLSGDGNAVVAGAGHAGAIDASALKTGVVVDANQNLEQAASLMAELYWGVCGTGAAGEWLNLPDRYLGLRFRGADGTDHYGWAKVTTTAYVDRHGVLHATTVLSGYAYETIPGQAIVTGQTSDSPSELTTRIH